MYYWLMYFLRKDGRKTELFGHNSYLLISMLVVFNIFTIAIVISYFFNVKLKELGIDKQTTQLIGIAFGVIVIGFNHFYLYKNQNEICKHYDDLSHKRRIKGMIMFWLYVILSISLLFTLGPALT